jgi:hypothetical protein
VLFTHLYEERMEFIEETRVAGQLRLQKFLGLMVVRGSSDKSMPRQYAPGISIRDEGRALRRIEEDGVSRFRTQPPEVQ